MSDEAIWSRQSACEQSNMADKQKLQVETCLLLGVQLDEFDYRVFLREYYRSLRRRFSDKRLPAYDPNVVLDELIPELEVCDAGGCSIQLAALRDFARSEYRLDLGLTGADYGPYERRASPYEFDRVFYHLGLEVVSARVRMDAPGYNPYRSTRRLDIPFTREHIGEVLDFLPDYLWWEIHDKTDVIRNVLVPEQLHDVRRRIDRSGYKLDDFGLYVTTMECLAAA
jgi:hypothetical protein